MLVKTTEEMRELRRFTRIFPTPSTHTYLTYLGRGLIAKFWIILDEVVPLKGQCRRMVIFYFEGLSFLSIFSLYELIVFKSFKRFSQFYTSFLFAALKLTSTFENAY